LLSTQGGYGQRLLNNPLEITRAHLRGQEGEWPKHPYREKKLLGGSAPGGKPRVLCNSATPVNESRADTNGKGYLTEILGTIASLTTGAASASHKRKREPGGIVLELS